VSNDIESMCCSQLPVLPLQRRDSIERSTLGLFAIAEIFGASCDARSQSPVSIGLMVVKLLVQIGLEDAGISVVHDLPSIRLSASVPIDTQDSQSTYQGTLILKGLDLLSQ